MTELDILRQEYMDWVTAANKPQSPDTMLEFLSLRQAIRARHELPVMVFGEKTHILSIYLVTDGDFSCSHPEAVYDEQSEGYCLIKTWGKDENPVGEAVEILQNMKKDTSSHRDYVKASLDAAFDKAIEGIDADGYADVHLGGNYEGTRIVFGGTSNEE